jgi:AcrR family transcriptional regulator
MQNKNKSAGRADKAEPSGSKSRAQIRCGMSDKLKQRLYPAVLELFSGNDFHRVNIREISRRTGVSSGTIYKYFASKEELIFTILDGEIAKISRAIAVQIQGMKDIKEIFRKVFWITMDFYDRHPGVAVTAFITVPMRTWMQDKSYNRHDDLTLLKQMILDAKKKNRIDPSLTFGRIIDAYYMVCYRYIHNWYYCSMSYKLTDRIDEYFNLFWKMMVPVSKDMEARI